MTKTWLELRENSTYYYESYFLKRWVVRPIWRLWMLTQFEENSNGEKKKKECLISPIWCMTQREQHKQTEKTNRWSDRYAGARPWRQWQQSVVILKSCELKLAASEAWGGWVQHGLCFACGRHSEWHYSEPFEVFQLVVKKIDDSKAITTQ